MKITPKELAAALKVELSVAEALLEASSNRASPSSRRRARFVFAFVLVGAVAVAGVRSQVLAMLTAVGPPAAGELVPRQIPYRGYLEENGQPARGMKPMQFRLLPGDGGISPYWDSQSLSVAVEVGQFEVALGDDMARPIPETALRDPGVRLEIAVDGRPLGTQRLLSTGFAQRSLSAARSDSAASADFFSVARDLSVGGAAALGAHLSVDGGLRVLGDAEFTGVMRRNGVPVGEPVPVCEVISGIGTTTVNCPAGKLVAFASYGRAFSQVPACGYNAGTGEDVRLDDDAAASCSDSQYVGFGCVGQPSCSFVFPAPGFSGCPAGVVVHLICI